MRASRRPGASDAWLWYLVAGSLLAVVYAFVPAGPAKLVVWPLIGWATVVAVVAGVVLHRPAGRGAWYLLALGVATFIVGDNLYSFRNFVQHAEALFPSYVDVVYLSMYPLLVTGLALLVRRRAPRRDREALIDAGIVTGGLGLLSWVLLINPYVSGAELSVVEKLASVAYPVGDVALLAMLLRLAVGGGRRSPSQWLLTAGMVALVSSDSAYGYLNLMGGWHEHHVIDAGWILFYVAWGAAALHPSMRTLSEPAPPGRVSRTRLALVGSAALVPPALLAVQATEGRVRDPIAIAVTSAVLFALVIARTAGLAREVARSQGEARFHSLVQNARDAVVVLDETGRVSYKTPSTARVLGLVPGSLAGRRLVDLVHPQDRAVLENVLAVPAAAGTVEWRAQRGDGSWGHFEVDVADHRSEHSVRGVVLTLRDITHRKELEEELRHRAFHDSLTGLANRALFLDRVSHALALHARRATSVVVLFLDLDDFKLVNDGLGHAAGDELLASVAARLSGAVRAGDSVARFGGDEFAVLLEDADATVAAAAAARISDALAAPFLVAGDSIPVRASMGIAMSGPDLHEPGELLRDADIAMYAAKRNGKARWELFAPEMHEVARRRLDIVNDLPGAITGGALRLLYQPIVDLASGRAVGAEALVRWDHPKYGPLSPAEFVPVAEATGLVVPMGRWVLEEACRVAATWRAGGRPDVYVTVNVSGRQLQDGSLIDDVALALAASGLPAGNLVVEVTESLLMDDVDLARRRLTELKQLGLRVAVDDFGTGYSSLSHLRNLPVDVVKIDKSFVDRVTVDAEGAAMVRAVVDLAGGLGLSTVAEGIEGAAQLSALRRLGCSTGQGYLFAKPVSAASVEALFGTPAVADLGAGA